MVHVFVDRDHDDGNIGKRGAKAAKTIEIRKSWHNKIDEHQVNIGMISENCLSFVERFRLKQL